MYVIKDLWASCATGSSRFVAERTNLAPSPWLEFAKKFRFKLSAKWFVHTNLREVDRYEVIKIIKL